MGSCFSVQKSSEAPVGRNQSVVSKAEEMVRVPEKKRRAENGGIGSVDERARQSSDFSLVRRSYVRILAKLLRCWKLAFGGSLSGSI